MPIPAAVTDLIGVTQYAEEGGFPVEHGYVWTTCAAVENGNPLFWDEDVATASVRAILSAANGAWAERD